jgi:hypothetical protein
MSTGDCELANSCATSTGGFCCLSHPGLVRFLVGSITGPLDNMLLKGLSFFLAWCSSTLLANKAVADTLRLGLEVNNVLLDLVLLLSTPFASPHRQGLAIYAATAFFNWFANFGILAVGMAS